jgi:hypothetical protein
MCYDSNLQHKGLAFMVSNCFGIGFDWDDEQLKEAVNNRDERVWEILKWAVNGGAKTYNEAAEFESDYLYYHSPSSILRHLMDADRDGFLEELENNPYLSAKARAKIESYRDGSLAETAIREREEERKTQKVRKSGGYVYLIRAENGLYKIGKAKNVSTRMQPFSVAFPMRWELLYSFKCSDYSYVEELLHAKYADKRDVGEWFKLEPVDVEYIKGIKDDQL